MTERKALFYQRALGTFNRGFERWYLVAGRDGTFEVERVWLRPAPLSDGQNDAGTVVVNAAEFFSTTADERLIGAARRALTDAISGDARLHSAAIGFDTRSAVVFDPVSTVVEWLAVCRARDVDRLLTFYHPGATLDCACTGQTLCNGRDELRAYWHKRLADTSPAVFSLQDIWLTADATVLEYISHGEKLVRSFFYFADTGLIAHTKCGPVEIAKAS